ncbi:recombinase family protein [Paenibacillus whitsoniae]|nr:recombinase family protein [Paenibacillus whitsoniae]
MDNLKGKVALYIRTVTADSSQAEKHLNVLLAECAQTGRGKAQVYMDLGHSGNSTERPALRRLLKESAAGDFSQVMVFNLSSISRDTVELLATIQYLTQKGIGVISVSEQLDSTTPMGKFVLSMFENILSLTGDGTTLDGTSKSIDATTPKGKLAVSLLEAFQQIEGDVIAWNERGGLWHE